MPCPPRQLGGRSVARPRRHRWGPPPRSFFLAIAPPSLPPPHALTRPPPGPPPIPPGGQRSPVAPRVHGPRAAAPYARHRCGNIEGEGQPIKILVAIQRFEQDIVDTLPPSVRFIGYLFSPSFKDNPPLTGTSGNRDHPPAVYVPPPPPMRPLLP